MYIHLSCMVFFYRRFAFEKTSIHDGFCVIHWRIDFLYIVGYVLLPYTKHSIICAFGTCDRVRFWSNLCPNRPSDEKCNALEKTFSGAVYWYFFIAVVFFNDIFTLIFSFGFFWILKRKKWANLYYFIALCVIFIELIGTGFQCWKWVPLTFSVIPAANPPMGAVFFYAGGDVLIGKIVRKWEQKWG